MMKTGYIEAMSRSISIWYEKDGKETNIDIGARDLLGTQSLSKEFWSLQVLKDIGLKELVLLGRTDPICFSGWEELMLLGKEIASMEANQAKIQFNERLKDRWIDNLRFCYDALIRQTPENAQPYFMIG